MQNQANRLIVALLGLAPLGLFTVSAGASDWPQWRGPNRDAVSAEKGLLQAWPADGPAQPWRANDIGAGYSTPAVAAGKVFLISNKGVESESVRAFSLADGKPIWTSRSIGRVGNPNQRPNYPAARGTPTVDGDLLYAVGSDGDVAAIKTATGEIVWTKSFRKDFGGMPGDWAYAESPLIDGSRLIVTPGGATSTVVALDKKTGEVLWKCAAPGGDDAGYASAVLAEIQGVRQIVQFLGKGAVGIDAATGKLLWSFADTSGRANITTPIVEGDLVFTAGGLGAGGVAKITLENGKWSATKLYTDKRLPQSAGGLVKVGGYLYGATQSGLACVDFKTGQVKWQDKSIGPASILYADNRLYLHGEDGRIALVEASSDRYKEAGRFMPPNLPERQAKDKAYPHPVIADGKLLIRDGEVLICYDVKGK